MLQVLLLVVVLLEEKSMKSYYGCSALENLSLLPSYFEDEAFYGYNRMNHIRCISECCDPIILASVRKPTLDEQEGSISFEN